MPSSEPKQTRITESQILLFEEDGRVKNTVILAVRIKSIDERIGSIRWNIKYRQYMYHPIAQTPHNIKCLADITSQLQALMDDWAEKRGRLPKPAYDWKAANDARTAQGHNQRPGVADTPGPATRRRRHRKVTP